MKISIICPTYNCEKYIKDCIDSVIAQDYLNWELIIVDDGSTDRTPQIVDCFLKRDNRIKYFFKKNEGQGIARNYGLNYATGDYITFLDADDYLDNNYLSQVVPFIKNKTPDVISTNFKYIKKDKSITISLSKETKEFGFCESYDCFLKDNIFHSAPWAKFYSAAFINKNGIAFPSFKAREDSYFLNYVFCLSNISLALPLFGYNVRIREGSTEGSPFNVEKLHSIDSGKIAIELCLKHHPSLIDSAHAYYYKKCLGVAIEYCRSLKVYKSENVRSIIANNIKISLQYSTTKKDKKSGLLFLKSPSKLRKKILFLDKINAAKRKIKRLFG